MKRAVTLLLVLSLALLIGCQKSDISPVAVTAPTHLPDVQAIIVITCKVPSVTVAASQQTLWPPNKKMVTVTFSGTVVNNCDGASYTLTDEYGIINYNGAVPAGNYSVPLALQASRHGKDKSGRTYTFSIVATNSAGSAVASVDVVVPHDKKDIEVEEEEDD